MKKEASEKPRCQVKYLHQNKEGSKEQQRGPLHPVQDDLKVLHVSQNQKPQGAQDGDPT